MLAFPRLGECDSAHESETVGAEELDEIVGRRPVEALPHAGRVAFFGVADVPVVLVTPGDEVIAHRDRAVAP